MHRQPQHAQPTSRLAAARHADAFQHPAFHDAAPTRDRGAEEPGSAPTPPVPQADGHP